MTENEITPVQVALRIRPMVESEIANGYQRALETVRKTPQVFVKGMTDKSFTFNHVFDSDVTQEDFYNKAVKNIVQNLFKGYNVTVLAYGQTGSGKTHTMGTSYDGDQEQMGVIQRAINDIFAEIDENEEFDFQVSVSFIELYQEFLYDLLADRPRDQSIVDIREDINGIRIAGLTELVVNSPEEMSSYLRHGSHLRVTGATAMNAHSSRSHAIITIAIEQINKETGIAILSKFHLVDLAGSERPKKTKATGERFKEGIKINQGLLALGNVISALGDEQKSHGYISYRDSKLTRLLQDSLGGNSITLMIACVSPASYNLDETVSTLRYADRARKIKNKPIVNQDPRQAEISKLNQQLKELQLQLNDQSTSRTSVCDLSLREENEALLGKNRELTEQLQKVIQENTILFERTMITENSQDKLVQKLAGLNDAYNSIYEKLNLSKVQMEIYQELGLKINEIQEDCKIAENEVIHYDANGQEESTLDSPKQYEVIEDQDTHMRQQMAFSTQLSELTKRLAIKTQLASKIAENSALQTIDKNALLENETKITSLVKERDELMQQLKNVQNNNQNSKGADQRRYRVHELESHIQDLQRKVREQARMIKLKDRNDSLIKELNNEIMNMKQTKIKLVKLMRQESDKFKQWKCERDREVIKLRDQNRKRQNEMMRLETIHSKQQSVLKRKFEEASAINKRLKDALTLQKAAQERRGVTHTKLERVQHWVMQELEILVSTVDAERTLDNLIEERKNVISNRNSTRDGQEDIESEIQWRTAQINDIRQKINEAELENKSKTRWDVIQSMNDAKCALKHLFELAADIKRKEMLLEADYRDEIELYKQKLQIAESKYCDSTLKHEKQLAELEKQYEDKVFALLQQIYAQKAGGGDQNFEFLPLDSLSVDETSELVGGSPTSARTVIVDTSDENYFTPMGRAPSITPVDTPKSYDKLPSIDSHRDKSQNTEPTCKCKNNCQTRQCTCRKVQKHCSHSCKCTHICQNKVEQEYLRSSCSNRNIGFPSVYPKRPKYDSLAQSSRFMVH